MAHSVIILREKIDCLQGQNITGAGQLETLWTNIQAADAYINSPEADKDTADAAHEWLEEVQTSLTSACAGFSQLNSECPNLT